MNQDKIQIFIIKLTIPLKANKNIGAITEKTVIALYIIKYFKKSKIVIDIFEKLNYNN